MAEENAMAQTPISPPAILPAISEDVNMRDQPDHPPDDVAKEGMDESEIPERTQYLKSRLYDSVGKYADGWLSTLTTAVEEDKCRHEARTKKKNYRPLQRFEYPIKILRQVSGWCKGAKDGYVPFTAVSMLSSVLVPLVHYDWVKKEEIAGIFTRVAGTRAPKQIGHIEKGYVVLFTDSKINDKRELDSFVNIDNADWDSDLYEDYESADEVAAKGDKNGMVANDGAWHIQGEDMDTQGEAMDVDEAVDVATAEVVSRGSSATLSGMEV